MATTKHWIAAGLPKDRSLDAKVAVTFHEAAGLQPQRVKATSGAYYYRMTVLERRRR